MRADSRSTHPEFPWHTVIRMEMETWVPERLPEHFLPAPPRRAAPQRAWRPLAVGFAVLVVAGVAFAHQDANGDVTTAVHFVTTTAARLAPAPPPAPTPVPVTTARPLAPPVVTTRPQAAPTPATTAAPSPATPATDAPSPPAEPTPSDEPGMLQQLLPPPAQTPDPGQTSSRLCLPLNLLCF